MVVVVVVVEEQEKEEDEEEEDEGGLGRRWSSLAGAHTGEGGGGWRRFRSTD